MTITSLSKQQKTKREVLVLQRLPVFYSFFCLYWRTEQTSSFVRRIASERLVFCVREFCRKIFVWFVLFGKHEHFGSKSFANDSVRASVHSTLQPLHSTLQFSASNFMTLNILRPSNLFFTLHSTLLIFWTERYSTHYFGPSDIRPTKFLPGQLWFFFLFHQEKKSCFSHEKNFD